LVPGTVYALHVPLKHCAYAIEPGHRLRVSIASAEFQNAWPTGEAARNTVYLGGGRASHIVLPVAPIEGSTLPVPAFAPSPHPLPKAEALARPEYGIHLDLVNDTVTCELRTQPGGRMRNHSRYTVSNRNPAQTVIASSTTHVAVHPTLDIRVEADCRTVSDATSYTHLSTVRITVDGSDYFHKSWSESVPRKLS
jgi:hypothetical protein